MVAQQPAKPVEVEGFMELATAIAVLREQLLTAQTQGEAHAAQCGRNVSFGVDKGRGGPEGLAGIHAHLAICTENRSHLASVRRR